MGDIKLKFVFDLDGTLTSVETLPVIAKHFEVEAEIDAITAKTISGNIPFVESFIQRVGILGKQSCSEINTLLEKTPLFPKAMEFIQTNSEHCIVATGNLDVWTHALASRIGCDFRSAKAKVTNDQVEKIEEILRKERVVSDLKENGEFTVYIGDGNNDAEAMRIADISIAVGLVHEPARSVMAVCDFVVYSEDALVRLLNQILNGEQAPLGNSLVLSCAGIGSRLGLNSTKTLINFDGQPLIKWLMAMFTQVEDIRVVVGYQAEQVIDAALAVNPDTCFVFNHEYFSTGTGYSLYLGSRFANEYVIAWDGDLLVHADDVGECLSYPGEFLGYSDAVTADGVFIHLDETKSSVVEFSRTKTSPYEWSGPAKLRRARLKENDANVFDGLIDQLPLPAKYVRAFDIDTPSDYDYALENFEKFGIKSLPLQSTGSEKLSGK